ncbi:glycosyltransferase family 1 protein [Chloroflexia bacterium SDU3-3]|nr:glycosyltransferase family 1 protein [Chloroflexia bacterium SDU3-3]
MRVLISTFGTYGDIQPFIALGRGLRDAGHEVALCASEEFQPLIESHGLSYAFMRNTLLDLSRALLKGGTTFALLRQIKAAMRHLLEEEWRAAQLVQPDLIVHHPKMLGSYHIAEKLGIPLVMAIPLPFYTPTRAFPNPFFGAWRLGPQFNLLSYHLNTLSSAVATGMTNFFRQHTLGLPRQRRFADMLRREDGQPIPILYPYSPALLPRPDDFPAHVHVTGSWFLDQAAEWQADPALCAFLSDGPPPVYVGFGSMSGKHANDRTRIVLDALSSAGQRGILACGWGGLQATDLPKTAHLIDAAPHDWLFPQVVAVVHHGGAGTTAAGLRAGRPTVICPFLGDQPFWGAIVHARGLGPQPIPQRRLSAGRLAAAIHAAVSDAAMRRRAADMGRQIQAEDGVGAAVAIIEQVRQAF